MNFLYIAPRLHPNYTDSLCALNKTHKLKILVSFQAENERHENLSVSGFPDGYLSRILNRFHSRAGLAPEQIAYRKRHPSLLWLIRFIINNQVNVVYARRDNKNLLRTAWLAARLTRRRFASYRQEVFDPTRVTDKNAIYPVTALLNECSSSLNYIPLSIDLVRFDRSMNAPPYIPGKEEPLRIMAVGKLIERKGHQLLIEAVVKLRKKLSLQVSIYGGYSRFHAQEYGQQLENIIRTHNLQDIVKLMPQVEPNAMINEYEKHHVFVYSGWVGIQKDIDEYTYGRANGSTGTRLYSLLEAMAAGLPAIISSEKYVVGAIENKSNGLVFEKGDAADLASKIEKISQMNLMEMGKRSREIIVSNYSSKDYPTRLVKFFENDMS